MELQEQVVRLEEREPYVHQEAEPEEVERNDSEKDEVNGVNEELEQLRKINNELEEKLQSLLGEYAVLKQDNEIIKTKARQMLIEKDKELDKLKGIQRDQEEETQLRQSEKSETED